MKRKMPTVAKKKGTLHPQGKADKAAAQVKHARHEQPMPHGIKTPKENMPNRNLAHSGKKVAKGSHTNAGGAGFGNGSDMLMARKTKKLAKKRRGA